MISLKTFLTVLFRYCDEHQLDCMFARHYTAENLSKFQKNIAVFAHRKNLSAIVKMLTVWPDIELMGRVRHPTFTRLYIHGIKQSQCRFLALDIHHEASFEGTPYLNLSDIFLRQTESATQIGSEPHPVDLALIVLFDDILKSRFVPDQARQSLMRALKNERRQLHDALITYCGVDAPIHLDNVIDIYDGRAMRKLISGFRHFAYQTQSIGAYVNRLAYHVAQIYQAVWARGDLHLAIIGTDGSGKSTLVHNMIPAWRNSRDEIAQSHILPHLHDKIGHGLPRTKTSKRYPFWSNIILVYQFILCWIARFVPRRNSRTILYDGYIGTIMIEPEETGFTGSAKFAKTLLRFLPRLDAVIWMATPPSIAHSRKTQSGLNKLTRDYALYKQFAEESNTHMVYTTTTDMDHFIKELCMLLQERMD
jgi:hypothetical protein